EIPAVRVRVVEVVGVFRAVDEQLLRHAADVDAGPPEVGVLGDGHPGAVARGHACGPHATGTGADDEQIVVVIHAGTLAKAGEPSESPRLCKADARPYPVAIFGEFG